MSFSAMVLAHPVRDAQVAGTLTPGTELRVLCTWKDPTLEDRWLRLGPARWVSDLFVSETEDRRIIPGCTDDQVTTG